MASGIDVRCDGNYSVALRRSLAIAVHHLRPLALGAALIVAAFVALTGTSIPAHALSCPDETGHSSANPVDITYYLTATTCTKVDPGSGVLLSARVEDSAASVTFLRPGTTDPVVSTSFTTGASCNNNITTTTANVAGYSFGSSVPCTTTVRLGNGAEMVFVSNNDSGGFSASLTGVTMTVPATTTTVTSSSPSLTGNFVGLNAEVRGGTGSPTGQVTFRDGLGPLGTETLGAAGSDLSVVSIASGVVASHACAITTAGGVKCWGNNGNGRLGDGTETSSTVPVEVQSLSGVVAIGVGAFHSCALTTAGGVKCWGSNVFGQLGDGFAVLGSSTPVDVTGLTSGVTAIAVGKYHSCALTSSGGVKCWGDGSSGQVGDGFQITRSTPVDVTGLTSGVGAIASGGDRTCAIIAATGAAKCWGSNASGGIGDTTTTTRLVPTDVSGLTSGVAQVSVGDEHTCAVTTAGAAMCWGSNGSGQLGDASQTQRLTPVAVSTLGSNVVSISAGRDHTCALMTTGAAKCWGSNGSGELGTGASSSSLPVDVVALGTGVKSIVTAFRASYAVTTGLGAKSWGDNESGRLGDGGTTNRSLPGDVSGLAAGRATATLFTQNLGAGQNSIAVDYPGDADRTGSTSATLVHTVNKNPSSTTVTASPVSPTGFGQSVTFTATITPNTLGPSPGTVSFSDSLGGVLGVAAVNAGVATLTTSALAPGTRTITATYSGSAFFDGSSGSRAHTVNKGATTTILGTSSTGQVVGTPVTLTASVGAVAPASGPFGGVVTFFRANGAVAIGTAAVSANKATLVTAALPAGANQLIARYDVAGADTRLAGSTSAVLVVNVTRRASTTALTATPNPVSVGSGVTLTATVTGSGATGNVVFRNGAATIATVALGAGKATTVFSPPAAGTLALSAAYAGNATVNASTSATVNVLAAAPCSDAFSAALAIPGANGSVFGSTVGATGEAGEPNHAGNSGALNSVWCSWTAPATGTVTIDTTGSVFDTTLGVYTGGSVGGLTPVAANDNIGPGSSQSRVSFAASAGTTYRIAVDGVSATGRYVLNVALAAGTAPTLAAVLPTARSVTTGTTATAFATIINAGTATATACSLALPPGFPATFRYQATNAANALVGTVDTPVNIAAGTAQSFAFAVTPLVDLNASDVALVFDCANTPTTVTVSGLNTLLLSASSTPVPDLIATSATASGDAIANIPGASGTAVFAGAALNIGATDNIVATIDDNGRNLALTALICVTDPATGACVNPASPAPVAIFTLATGSTATYAVFVTGRGNVPFDPANNRLFVRFKTADGVTRGATSVAVRTQ